MWRLRNFAVISLQWPNHIIHYSRKARLVGDGGQNEETFEVRVRLCRTYSVFYEVGLCRSRFYRHSQTEC